MLSFRYLLLLFFIVFAGSQTIAQNNVVTYAGGAGTEKFNGVLELSDGTILISGQADNLTWIPGGVTIGTLSGVNRYASQASSGIGFIMRVSADLQTVLSVVQFPASTVKDVFRIKTNGLPGGPTKDIYISGSRDTISTSDGYYIARLNNNFINGTPTGVTYYKVVDAPARNGGSANLQFPSGTESAYKQTQPWDVTSDGRVIYASGNDFSFDRTLIQVMNSLGEDTLVDYFSNHTPNWTGVPATSFLNTTGNPVFDLKSSSLSLKYSNSSTPGAFRSYANSLFETIGTDENGNPGRKGSFATDAFFNSYQAYGGAPIVNSGPGYTGYAYNPTGGIWTGRVGSIVVDRRNNHFYIGASFSVSSTSNQQNLDDAEPAVIAFAANGLTKWWARLHKEDGLRSSAQQHVEGLDIDYAHDQLVVLGRTRGDSPNNFWKGNELTQKPGGNGYQNSIRNTSGPGTYPDFGWLGKYSLNDGKIKHSTYIGELSDVDQFSTASSNPNYDGFPNMNNGNFQLGSTVVTNLSVDPSSGNVVISGTGLRTMTSLNAYQKMFKAKPYQQGGGLAAQNSFVRIYNMSLDSVTYSSLITGLWNPEIGASGNTVIRSVVPTSNGLFAVGYHDGFGNDLATLNTPAWGNSSKNNISALFGKLGTGNTVPSQPDSIVKPTDLCTGTTFQFSIPAVSGATSYKWVIEATGWTGTSATNTISLDRGVGASAGYLTVYALNGSGISLGRTTALHSNATVTGPTAYTFPGKHCGNQTQAYYVNEVDGAVSYNWQIVGTGCGSWQLGAAATAAAFVNITTGNTITNPCSLQVVANGCANSSNPVLFPLPTSGVVPSPPVFSGSDLAPCVGIPKTYGVQNNTNAESYIWTVSGNGFSGNSSSSSIDITAAPGATNGSISVVAVNQCGSSAMQTLPIGNAITDSTPNSPASIVGPLGGFCSDDTLSYTASSVSNATSYNWYSNQSLWIVGPSSTNENKLFIPQTGGNPTGLLFVQAVNNCGASNPANVLIRKGIPDIAGSESIQPALAGGICEGSTVTFSINPVYSATSYEWSFPTGWTINGTGNSNSVSVTAAVGAVAGNIKVKAFNSCGYDSLSRATPELKTNAASFSIQPSDINGNIDLCAGTTKILYIQGTFTGIVNTFHWMTPTGVYVQNSSVSTPTFDTVRISATEAAQTGSITVIMSGDQCGMATAQFKRGTPDAITGSAELCTNPLDQTYKINKVSGATTYEWLIEPASAGVLSTTDTTVIINWDDAFSGIATLKVRAITSCGPSLYSSTTITVGLPNASVQTPNPTCANSPVTLQASGGSQYNWYAAATGGAPLATNNGTYIVTVSTATTFYVTIVAGTCESALRTPVLVSISNAPAAPTTNNVSACLVGGLVTMTASGAGVGDIYNWYNVATGGTSLFSGPSYSTTISSTDTFYVSYTSAGCESQRAQVIASIVTLPTPTAPNVTVCSTGPVSLVASGATGTQTYKWYDAETGGTLLGTGSPFSYDVQATVTLYVAIAEDTCQSPVRKAVTITLTTNPPGPSTTNGSSCGPGLVNISATSSLAGAVFEWYDAPIGGTLVFTGPVYSVNLTTTDTFYVRAVVPGGCSSSRTFAIGRIKPIPPMPTSVSGDIICGNNSASLSSVVPAGNNAQWFDALTGGTALFTGLNFNTPLILDTTSYYVATLGTNGCTSARLEVIAIVKPIAAEPLTSNVERCGPGSILLTAATNPAEAIIKWFDTPAGLVPIATGGSFTTPVLSATTTYYVSATLGDCETTRIPVSVSINANTAPPQTLDGTRCGPGTVLLTATSNVPNATLYWYDSQVSTIPLASGGLFTTPVLSASTTYYVSASLPGCESNRVAVLATVNPGPEAPQSTDVSQCGSSSFVLTATTSVQGAILTWYDNPTATIPVALGPSFSTPVLSSQTSYYVSVTLPGCESNRVEVKAIVVPIPPQPAVSDFNSCGSSAVTIPSNTGVNGARWYETSTSTTVLSSDQNYSTTVTVVDTFWVSAVSTVNNLTCESARSRIIVTNNPKPASPTTSNKNRCGPGIVQLVATGGTAQSTKWWDSPNSTNPLSQGITYSPNVSESRSYYVSITDLIGCESDRIKVEVLIVSPPIVTVKAEPSSIVKGEFSKLTATGGGTYAWTPTTNLSNISGPTTNANPQETITYKVKVNLNGCIDSSEVIVEVLLTDEVPNLLTPNGDNDHEVWEIPGIAAYPDNKIQVFNRWGSIVLDAAPYKNDWTGGTLPDGTYYYTLDYGSGKATRTGTVTIVRK